MKGNDPMPAPKVKIALKTTHAERDRVCNWCKADIKAGAACFEEDDGLLCSMECASARVYAAGHLLGIPERGRPDPYVYEMTADEPAVCICCGKTIPPGETLYGNDDQDDPNDFVDGDCCSVECLIEAIKLKREGSVYGR